jgi:hypothetical protein
VDEPPLKFHHTFFALSQAVAIGEVAPGSDSINLTVASRIENGQGRAATQYLAFDEGYA